jgi:hypothetical protein
MTKRYARVASSQVEEAVIALDSVLGDAISHPIDTQTEALLEEKPVSLLN